MDQIFVIMLIALAILAVIDITVGVSNDAVNFLNSAIGSKAVPFKTIMVVATLGILVGALFSNGMMEIARSGIFVPSMFSFNDVMIIFLAVMITDVLLLDVFNNLGLPTSTTVSIIFELLGAAVCLAVVKIVMTDGSLATLPQYINTEKASEIVYSILLSVILSFTIGTLVQYVSRMFFTFHIDRRLKYFGALFGGVAITAITFFILIKGLKGVSFISKETYYWINHHQIQIVAMSFVFWTLVSQLLMSVFRVHILKLIIIIGTFALALAFAGNDLVNFIGVPIAAFQAYEFFMGSGTLDPNAYMMGELANENIEAPFYFLVIAGLVMVYTLWTSKKARNVIETEMNLARQDTGTTTEKFTPNILSKGIVRGMVYLGMGVNYFLPKSLQLKIDKRFEKPHKIKNKKIEEPAFDMVRASVNLMVASILISIGTSMQLPLSTTYVTFMVAMGTSFADGAWDRDTAVYRVTGVFNVIGGWLVTAVVAFLVAFITAYILKIGEVYAVVALFILVGILLYRSNKKYQKKTKEKDATKASELNSHDIVTIQGVVSESSAQIATVIGKTKELYLSVIDSLGLQELSKLKQNRKKLKKLEKEIEELKGNVYFFVKNLDETSVEASKFYILTLGYLQDMVKAVSFIAQNSYAHVDNNHKKLKFNQIRDLKSTDRQLQELFDKIERTFSEEDFSQIENLLKDKETLIAYVDGLIQKQIVRIRTTETSPKNSKLYFSILFETDDLIKATMGLLELFKEFDLHVKK